MSNENVQDKIAKAKSKKSTKGASEAVAAVTGEAKPKKARKSALESYQALVAKREAIEADHAARLEKLDGQIGRYESKYAAKIEAQKLAAEGVTPDNLDDQIKALKAQRRALKAIS